MSTITGTKDAVLQARAIDDDASGLLRQSAPCIACKAIKGLEVVDDATDTVRCRGCGQVQSALGIATLRVWRDTVDDKGVSSCEVSDPAVAAITAAKDTVSKAPVDAKGVPIVDATTAKLAACVITADPKPADGGKEVTIK